MLRKSLLRIPGCGASKFLVCSGNVKLRFLPNAVSAQDRNRRIHPNCPTHILGPRVPDPLANALFKMLTCIPNYYTEEYHRKVVKKEQGKDFGR